MRTPRPLTILALLALLLGGPLLAPPRPAAAQAERCFAETNQCIQGRFLDYWQQHGGLAINGFPLSEERRELLEDGNEYTVQYFERVRLEYHPENAVPYDVLLGQFGRRVLSLPGRGLGSGPEPPTDPKAGQTFFPATGHNVAPDFLGYWQAHGGLAQFGYPLTEERGEGFGAQTYTVQYFERARFERHPENAPPYDILLGQFGRDFLAQADRLSGAFGRLYLTDATVQRQLGRPFESPVQTAGAAQEFEHGRMLYRGDLRRIYVLCGEPAAGIVLVAGQYDRQGGSPQTPFFPDTWQEGDEPGGGPAPAPGLFAPQRGFGKVWREHPEVQRCLGYATSARESGYSLTAQYFELAVVLSGPEGRTVYAITTESFKSGGLTAKYTRYDLPPR
jgi:hypothetical protein